MLTVRLRRFVSAHQHRALPLVLLVWAGVLSLHFTIRACRALSPADSALELAALGTLGEVAKLYFGPRALLGFLNTSRPWARVGHLALLLLVLVLMAGSVGASVLFTTHTEGQALAASATARSQALAASAEHNALSKDIETYDTRIERALDAADRLRSAGQLTNAEKKDREVSALKVQKDAAVLRRAGLDGAALPAAAASVSVRWVHVVVAMVLELVGIAAGVLLHAARPPVTAEGTAGSIGPGVGTVVRLDVTRRSVAVRAQSAGQADVGKRFTARYVEARRLVVSGAVRPTLDALGRAVRVSQRPAKRFLEALCDEGIIEWNGRHYLRRAGAALRA